MAKTSSRIVKRACTLKSTETQPIKSLDIKSWFMRIRKILNKYKLMSIFAAIANPSDKNKRKSMIYAVNK